MFGLRVTGDPGATVGLVAVDKGVYVLNNQHRLTQKKVHLCWHITADVARFTYLTYILSLFNLLYYLVWPNPDLGHCGKVWHRLHSRRREGQHKCVLWCRPVVWVQPGYRDRLQKRWNPNSKPAFLLDCWCTKGSPGLFYSCNVKVRSYFSVILQYCKTLQISVRAALTSSALVLMYFFNTLKQVFRRVLTINNWRSFPFVPEQKCKTEPERKKRALTIMDVTTSLSKFRPPKAFIFCDQSTGLIDLTDLSPRLTSVQQVNTKMSWSVSAVWMECTWSLFHTAARGAASIYRTARPVSRPSSTVARRSRSTARRVKSRASSWPEVRVDRVWVATHAPSPAQNPNWSVRVTELVTRPGCIPLLSDRCSKISQRTWSCGMSSVFNHTNDKHGSKCLWWHHQVCSLVKLGKRRESLVAMVKLLILPTWTAENYASQKQL